MSSTRHFTMTTIIIPPCGTNETIQVTHNHKLVDHLDKLVPTKIEKIECAKDNFEYTMYKCNNSQKQNSIFDSMGTVVFHLKIHDDEHVKTLIKLCEKVKGKRFLSWY